MACNNFPPGFASHTFNELEYFWYTLREVTFPLDLCNRHQRIPITGKVVRWTRIPLQSPEIYSFFRTLLRPLKVVWYAQNRRFGGRSSVKKSSQNIRPGAFCTRTHKALCYHYSRGVSMGRGQFIAVAESSQTPEPEGAESKLWTWKGCARPRASHERTYSCEQTVELQGMP